MGTSELGQSGFSDSMSGQQIYDNFVNAKGPGDLQQAQDHLRVVMSTYKDRLQQITSLAASMEDGWTGDASEAAQRSAVPLAFAHEDAAVQMMQASQLIESQTQAFYDTKNKVVPVPEVPKSPSLLDTVVTLGSANTTHLIKVVQSQAAAQQNVNAMQAWSTTSADNGSRMPTSYGDIDGSAFDVTMASSASGGPSVPGGGSGSGSGSGGNIPGAGGTGLLTGNPPAGTGLPPSGSPDQHTTPVRYNPPVPAPGPVAPPIGQPFPPPGRPVPPPPIGGPGPGLPPIGPITPPEGPPPSRGRGGGSTGGIGGGTGSGSGSGGRFGGSGGRGAGSSSGSGAGEKALGEGNRVGSGAGKPGAVNESLGRAGSTGAAGRPGASGLGAGAAGGKGKGEEDTEHERKYVLDEDEAFQLTEEGERLIDPNTGLPVAPPVIGY